MKRFPSIKKHSDFVRISKEGRSITSGPLVMIVTDNDLGTNRIGITISHRQGNSVVRHTFARRIREIFRQCENSTVRGKDIVVIARNGIERVSFDGLMKNYKRLLFSHNILLEDPEKTAGEETCGKGLFH